MASRSAGSRARSRRAISDADRHGSSSRRSTVTALGMALAAAIGGCYQPRHVRPARLEITGPDAYALEGVPVARAQLAARVTPETVVEIHASPSVPNAAVERGVAAVRAAGAHVAFAAATAVHRAVARRQRPPPRRPMRHRISAMTACLPTVPRGFLQRCAIAAAACDPSASPAASAA